MAQNESSQVAFSILTLDKLVTRDHVYRKIIKLLDFKALCRDFHDAYSPMGTYGYAVEKGVKALILQFMEDYSDRQMERALAENLAVKWFCGFELNEKTPDFSYFSKLRKRLGTHRLAKLFQKINKVLEARGLLGKCFAFVDSTAIITKTQLWDERDRAILDGEKKLNNTNVTNYAADPDARLGCKGSKKYWFGHKRHIAMDAKAGIVTKVCVTPANVSDSEGLRHVCPKEGMVLADKAYCGRKAMQIMKAKGVHSGVILRNNMKAKNWDKDRWLTKVRMPFEGVFSFFKKRARYRKTAKVQMQAFMEAIVWNIKIAAATPVSS